VLNRWSVSSPTLRSTAAAHEEEHCPPGARARHLPARDCTCAECERPSERKIPKLKARRIPAPHAWGTLKHAGSQRPVQVLLSHPTIVCPTAGVLRGKTDLVCCSMYCRRSLFVAPGSAHGAAAAGRHMAVSAGARRARPPSPHERGWASRENGGAHLGRLLCPPRARLSPSPRQRAPASNRWIWSRGGPADANFKT
jgi:hypothetical protein